MANFILSIFLCFALALGGTAGLPAEPETATTWTIRNVTLSDGTDSVTLNPAVKITTAVGAEQAALRFEIDREGDTLLPMAAKVTPDAITFALSDGGRAYTVTEDTLLKMGALNEEDIQILTVVSDAITSYGALIGVVSSGSEEALAYSQKVTEILLETCGGEFVPVEIEVEGQTLSAQQTVVTLTYESAFALLDALRTCGIPELDAYLDAYLQLINYMADTDYADFSSLAADLYEEDLDEFNFPMTITMAEEDGLEYALVECTFAVQDEAAMVLREEVVAREDETSIDAVITLEGVDEISLDYVVSCQLTGPRTAPTAVHMNYDMVMETPVYSEDGDGIPETQRAEMHMLLEAVTEDELTNASLSIAFDMGDENGVIGLSSAERPEDDGSVTQEVMIIAVDSEDQIGISFEINRAEAAYEDFFAGAEIFEIDESTFDDDFDEISPAQMALISDVILLDSDAKQLASDESILAIGRWGAAGDDIVPDYGDEYADVETLEQAAEIYDGTLPNFTPPEGFELTSIDADEYYVDLEYASENAGFELSVYSYSLTTHPYIFADGELTKIDGCEVRLRDYDGDISGASVNLPDGTTVDFYFYGTFTLEEVVEVLNGLG